jgi:hypothetical protein
MSFRYLHSRGILKLSTAGQNPFSRTAIARLWQQDKDLHWCLKPSIQGGSESPLSIGTKISALKPSCVQELFYIGSPDGTGENLPVGDYNIFRNAVLANSPQCKFFVMISLGSVTWTPDTLVALMRKVDEQIRVDGWNFDFYWRATAYPDALKAAAEYAHLHGQLIGGSCLGAVDKIQPGSTIRTRTSIRSTRCGASLMNSINTSKRNLARDSPSSFTFLRIHRTLRTRAAGGQPSSSPQRDADPYSISPRTSNPRLPCSSDFHASKNSAKPTRRIISRRMLTWRRRFSTR